MASLKDIRIRLGHLENKEVVEEQKNDPITFDQYNTWKLLKAPTLERDKVTFDFHLSNDQDRILKCPHCDSEDTHHLGVELFNRHEDGNGEHISLYVEESHGWDYFNVKCPENTVDNNMKDNPSKRRTGISILFVCEYCQQTSKLNIAQHKGQSLMFWSYYK